MSNYPAGARDDPDAPYNDGPRSWCDARMQFCPRAGCDCVGDDEDYDPTPWDQADVTSGTDHRERDALIRPR